MCDMQAVLLQAVKDNAAGQPQFSIALYVAAPMDANITNNWQLLHVVDQRTLPGEDASFPLVKKRKKDGTPSSHLATQQSSLAACILAAYLKTSLHEGLTSQPPLHRSQDGLTAWSCTPSAWRRTRLALNWCHCSR